MSAIDTLESIINCSLAKYSFKYCFVNRSKIPYRVDGYEARPNVTTDFVDLDCLLHSGMITRKRIVGVGISIQASNMCAIDVDNCFSKAFDIKTIDDRGKAILEIFADMAYCEFSFSGKGLRILFLHDVINNYSDLYYIKNSRLNVEYYQPSQSYRFVTVTGRYIHNNPIVRHKNINVAVDFFLEQYMKKPKKLIHSTNVVDENIDLEIAINLTTKLYLCNSKFQNLWFSVAPGSGKDESEKDYQIIAMLYENVTTNEDIIKMLFEMSPYFKSKDDMHIIKWNNNNFRYYKYIYSHLR